MQADEIPGAGAAAMRKSSTNPVSAADYLADLSPNFELDVQKTALVIVDMQNATCSLDMGEGRRLAALGKLALARERFDRLQSTVIPNLRKMLRFFRENNLRVIYLTTGSEAHDYSDASFIMAHRFRSRNSRKGQVEMDVIEDLKPRPDELVINKTTISAFTASGIDAMLKNMRIDCLLFGGTSTNMCVGTTARDAADRGYRCLLIDDCCVAARAEYHEAELLTFRLIFGRVASSEQVRLEMEAKLTGRASPVTD